MKKILLTLLFTTLIFSNGFAANGKGEATEYKVTMKKVELCEDSTCSISTTVGERDMEADIAGATAGADVGNYAPTTGLPIGTTFSHIRITISRTFTITGSVVLTGDDCLTDGGSDSTKTQMLVGKTSGAAVSSTMILNTAGGYAASNGTRSGALDSGNFNIDYTTPNYATSLTTSGDNALMIYQLSAPFTVGLKAPTIKVTFNTETAVGADNNACAMWVDEPYVTIALTE